MQHLVTGVQSTRSQGLAGHRAVHQGEDRRKSSKMFLQFLSGLWGSSIQCPLVQTVTILLQDTAASGSAEDSDPVTQSSQEIQS